MDLNIFANRRDKLKRLLKDRKLPALIVSHAANRYYLSGFELHDSQCNESSGWLLITADGPDFLFTDPRFHDAAKRLWNEDDICCIYSARRLQTIAEFIKGKGYDTVCFEPQAMSLFDYEGLKETLTLQAAKELVEELRVKKDEDEIRRLRSSIDLNHRLFSYIEDRLIPGRTEKEIAWDIEKFFRENGAQELAFSTIVGVGPNAALPHCVPSDEPLRDGELVLIDTGCRLHDYNSDQTRTFWVGDKPSDRFKEVLAMVQGAQKAAIDVLRPGLSLHDGWKAAWDYLDQRGVAEHFTHGLGHGVGLETHEPPRLSKVAQGTLEPGMLVTVEPGLYWGDWGGIRWEHEVLITDNGCQVL